ncbi:hypothetical protein [Streptomyces sp. NPDC059009]|uniref:hypothetical protein n=1 Tax=Streptomyces sp. NPDC059009 TaxID=3346694 RepID=UPI0036C68132
MTGAWCPWQHTAYGIVQAISTFTHHEQMARSVARAERNMLQAISGGVDHLDKCSAGTCCGIGRPGTRVVWKGRSASGSTSRGSCSISQTSNRTRRETGASVNQHTEELLRDVVARMERAIRDRDCPAMVAVQGDRTLMLSDYDYLRDEPTADAFEERAAVQVRAVHAVRWVFAVPQVLVLAGSAMAARAVSNHPLREGEREAVLWVSCDRRDGVDYGLVPYGRRPDGAVAAFGEPEVFTVALRPGDKLPGRRLLHCLELPGL